LQCTFSYEGYCKLLYLKKGSGAIKNKRNDGIQWQPLLVKKNYRKKERKKKRKTNSAGIKSRLVRSFS